MDLPLPAQRLPVSQARPMVCADFLFPDMHSYLSLFIYISPDTKPIASSAARYAFRHLNAAYQAPVSCQALSMALSRSSITGLQSQGTVPMQYILKILCCFMAIDP